MRNDTLPLSSSWVCKANPGGRAIPLYEGEYSFHRHLLERSDRSAKQDNVDGEPEIATKISDLGLPYNEVLVEKCVRDNPAEGMRAMESLFDGEKPTAVFIVNERLGLGVLECLKNRGVKHPEDIEIITVGTDNSDLPGNDKIETVAISWTDMVESAVRMLFERIENPDLLPQSGSVPFYIDFPRNIET
ncbi:MAG: substrate-binding domain-containing protein [Victivallales bacterium]|nr:substrate-binding domain-containing protein [Victivallales bacterium]